MSALPQGVTMSAREAADAVEASWLNVDRDSHVPVARALGVLVDHARRTVSGGQVAEQRVAALVADLEALDEKFPGHVRLLIGPELCDQLLVALGLARPS